MYNVYIYTVSMIKKHTLHIKFYATDMYTTTEYSLDQLYSYP